MLPPILYETGTPVAELPDLLRSYFTDVRLSTPATRFQEDPSLLPLAVLDTVHVVENDGIVVAVGLDRSGRVLCTATAIDQFTGGSSCGDPTQLAFRESTQSTLSGDVDVTVLLLSGEIVAVHSGGRSWPAGNGLIIIQERIGPLELERSDGTRITDEFPPVGDASASLVINGTSFDNAVAVGCTTVNDGFLATVAVTNTDGNAAFIDLDERSIGIDGLGERAVITFDDGIIVSGFVEGERIIHATWSTPDSEGSLIINCADNDTDVTTLRPGN